MQLVDISQRDKFGVVLNLKEFRVSYLTFKWLDAAAVGYYEICPPYTTKYNVRMLMLSAPIDGKADHNDHPEYAKAGKILALL